MNPALEAARLARERGADFKEELEAFLLHGFVFSTPDAFLLARPVPKGFELQDVWQELPADTALNAWFVWNAAGSMSTLLQLMPYRLPWIGFVRQGRDWARTHWHSTSRLLERLGRKQGLQSCHA